MGGCVKAGSGVRRALEYDPNAVFYNGVNDKEITHIASEFLITIPRKTDQVIDQVTDQLQSKTDQATDQPRQDAAKVKIILSKKQQDIRNFCTVPRTAKEILQRAKVSAHFDNSKEVYLRFGRSWHS